MIPWTTWPLGWLASWRKGTDYRGVEYGSDSVAEHSPETLEILKRKHPSPCMHIQTVPPFPHQMLHCLLQPSLKMTSEGPLCLSPMDQHAGGPDGLRPQHLKDLIGPSATVGGPLLLSALTSLVNLMLRGATPVPIRTFFFGAKLVALRKKQGGVRPIAVGCTLRRLAAKCASSIALKEIPDMLPPGGIRGPTRYRCCCPCYPKIPPEPPGRPSHHQGGLSKCVQYHPPG